MAATTLNSGEAAQLQQTIEMFEVIVQSQPSDTQSLEILKEAYSKLGREDDVVNTSKRIAQAYLQQASFLRPFWNMRPSCNAGRMTMMSAKR